MDRAVASGDDKPTVPRAPRLDEMDAQGKPIATGRWFWKPNPEMSQFDVSKPAAEKCVADTFARLTDDGVCYFKIDFISGAPSLRRAMAAVRRGAGPDAWIRFIQTPPLVSAATGQRFLRRPRYGRCRSGRLDEVMRENDSRLAASYWTNGRLFRREICDMGVG